MIFELVMGVLVFVVVPAAVMVAIRFYREGIRHHSSMWFEMWVCWRTWRIRSR